MDEPATKAEESPAPPRMPRATDPGRMVPEIVEERAERAAAAIDARNPIFDTLVRDEADLEGLLAYALYKQNKRDWLIAFERSNSRPPDERELASYILGERTPRRIDTYRRLAAEALAGQSGGAARKVVAARVDNGPARPIEPPAATTAPHPTMRIADGGTRPAPQPASPGRSSSLVTLASIVVVAIVAAYLVYRFGGLILGR